MVKYNISGHMYHHNQRWEVCLIQRKKKKNQKESNVEREMVSCTCNTSPKNKGIDIT